MAFHKSVNNATDVTHERGQVAENGANDERNDKIACDVDIGDDGAAHDAQDAFSDHGAVGAVGNADASGGDDCIVECAAGDDGAADDVLGDDGDSDVAVGNDGVADADVADDANVRDAVADGLVGDGGAAEGAVGGSADNRLVVVTVAELEQKVNELRRENCSLHRSREYRRAQIAYHATCKHMSDRKLKCDCVSMNKQLADARSTLRVAT